jgi:hypothetical protein
MTRCGDSFTFFAGSNFGNKAMAGICGASRSAHFASFAFLSRSRIALALVRAALIVAASNMIVVASWRRSLTYGEWRTATRKFHDIDAAVDYLA